MLKEGGKEERWREGGRKKRKEGVIFKGKKKRRKF